jgi:hypothetical protein
MLNGRVLSCTATSVVSATEDQSVAATDAVGALRFASSIDADGLRMSVGANPDPSAASTPAGRAYVFERTSSGHWQEVAKLDPPAMPPAGNLFGFAVDIDGDRVAVGAPVSNASLPGLVHVYERAVGGAWAIAASIQRETFGFIWQSHGSCVDIEGDRLATSSFGGNWTQTTVAIFERNTAGQWTEVASPTAPGNPTAYGVHLDLDGDRLAAPSQVRAGRVYVFERSTLGSWGFVASVKPTHLLLGDDFGRCFDLEGNRMVVGAPGEDDRGNDAGAAYVFERQANGAWLQRAQLFAEDASADARFGSSVALYGDRIVVGAETGADSGKASGTAYVFERRSDGGWLPVVKLRSSLTTSGARFGATCALSADVIAIGAPQDDTAGVDSGSVLSFDIGSLYHGAPSISLASGGAQDLLVRAGPQHSGHVFVMFGSATGTSPGIAVPGTGVALPLTQDAYFDLLLTQGGARLLFPWVGLLDDNGAYDARFVVPGGANASLAGLVLRHACVLVDLATFAFVDASNAVEVELVP